MKNFSKIATTILAFLALIVVNDGFYIVDETEQVVITRLVIQLVSL